MRGNIIFWKFSNRKGRNRNEGEEERRMKMIVGVFLKIWGKKQQCSIFLSCHGQTPNIHVLYEYLGNCPFNILIKITLP